MSVSYTHLDVYKRQVYLHEGKAAGIAGDLRRMLDEDVYKRQAIMLPFSSAKFTPIGSAKS